jgi:hypothetical protein
MRLVQVARRKTGAVVERGSGHVGTRMGVNADTLRGWCKVAAIDAGERPGTTTGDAQRIKQMEGPLQRHSRGLVATIQRQPRLRAYVSAGSHAPGCVRTSPGRPHTLITSATTRRAQPNTPCAPGDASATTSTCNWSETATRTP